MYQKEKTTTRRHNAVLTRLLKAIPKKSQTVYTNQATPGCDTALRPDIVIINEKNKLATIIDVAIPFEGSIHCFNDAGKRKIEKYAGIEHYFIEKGYKTFNNAFAIGAPGCYDTANESHLKRLRIPHRYATLMKRLMVNDVIRWSCDFYTKHITGIRQYVA
uniref:Restriction endonuclease subunit S n=1 Tax=Panagrellus redivivus TaxID=6233 RepID=A0A7E4UPS0_PANRE